MAQDWEIKPRGECCNECRAAFSDGQVYLSRLVFGQDGYVRDDYCETCWSARKDSATRYSSWRGRYKSPPLPTEILQKETAESLLRRLMEGNDPTRGNAIFILAVMLERKKLLVEKDTQKNPNGSLTRVYEHRKTGETFLVPDPQLRLDQLEPVQREVVEMLGGGKTGQAPGETGESAPPEDPPDAEE